MFPTREGKSFNVKPKKPELTTLYKPDKPAQSRFSPGQRKTTGLPPQKGELVSPPGDDRPLSAMSSQLKGDGQMGMGMPPNLNGFGARLREVREGRNMSRQSLAKRTGVSEAAIKNYESGRHGPRMATLMDMATALRVPTDSLLKPAGSTIPAPRRSHPQ